MRTVELFCGIGGFRLAADRLGWRTLWANDLSPAACRVYRDRFGSDELTEGDCNELKGSIPAHDVLTGGFPCQPFSSAGKKHGVRDVRGTLFQTIVDVVSNRRPKFFILENVKRLLTMERGSHFATILGSLAELDYAIEWRLLNATHFNLPQNRERVVIVGERIDTSPLRPSAHVASTVRLAESADLRSIDGVQRDLLCDDRSWRRIDRHESRFPDWGLARSGGFFGADLAGFAAASPPTTLAHVLEDSVAPQFDFTDATLKWIEANTPVNRLVNGVEILSNQKGGARMGYTIFGTGGVAPTLTSTASRHYERYKVGERYRRLTNVEYARLQGFPDDHCRAVSVYDQYALFGNAVPPPLVAWVMKRLDCRGIASAALGAKRQRTLFDVNHA